MKKSLLFLAAVAFGSIYADAECKIYSFQELGEINGVSDNGHFGVVTDPDNEKAYIWRESSPEELFEITAFTGDGGNLASAKDPKGTTVMDISDEGIAVGSIRFGSVYNPAYYKDGEWHLLPLDPNAKNTNEAVCITPDGKVIAGYQFINDPAADLKGYYYPCQWFLDEDGSYKLKTYTNIELPDHQGFIPFTQTNDGKVVAGTVYAAVQSQLNAILQDGELILFDEITEKKEPFMFGGQYEGRDENGNQIWVDDINDSRVVYYTETYINGYKDGNGGLVGFFLNCDNNGNLYGCRSRVDNLTEEGTGDVSYEACIYNYETKVWYTEPSFNFFSAGISDKLLFTNNGKVIDGDKVESVSKKYNVGDIGTIEGINRISSDARVLGGVLSEYNPAIGLDMYYPFFIVTKEASGIHSIEGSLSEGVVIATAGKIEVLNTDDIAVYDLNGLLIGKDKTTYVNPGVYVVKAGSKTHKIQVK